MIAGMKSAADVWICDVCRSINPLNSNRCYRCHTPIQIAAAKPHELSVQRQPREAHTEPVGTYRSTESLAVLVTVGAVAFILAGLLALWTNYTINDLRASDGRSAADAPSSSVCSSSSRRQSSGCSPCWPTRRGSGGRSTTCRPLDWVSPE
jgi:hypothetical protein